MSVIRTDEDEGIVLRRTANIRVGRGRAVGTLFVTTKRLLFSPLNRARQIDIRLKDIETATIVGVLFKKMQVCTADTTYTLFMKGAANVLNLVQALMEAPSVAQQ